MAKQRKRRKGVGPPPAASPRRAAQLESGAAEKAGPKRKSNEPAPASPRGVFMRAGLVAAVFYPYLIFFAGESTLTALAIAVIAFALMVPLGLFFDRLRYNRQMRKYTEKRARSAKR